MKLRGFRIELGEVEAALLRQPGVEEAAAVVREDSPGNRRLVAYVVGEALDGSALRSALKQHLPDYMVPSAFVTLAALPLSPSGKLDRKALPAPDAAREREELAPPRTPLEELLVGLWADVLGHATLGIHDDFFELGGHSLLATQLVARMRAVLGQELPLQELFDHPTVAAVAERLAASRSANVPPAPPLRARHHAGDAPLSFAQEAYWSPERRGPASRFNTVLTPLRLDGPLDAAALQRALEELVRRHESLRTTFPVVDGAPVQRVLPAGPVPLPVVELGGLPAEAREPEAVRRIREEGARPFELERGPLLRAVLYRLADTSHVLLVAMHHAITDLVSGLVLLRELSALYGAFETGQPSPLPELALQYRDFTLWQREALSGDTLELHRAYWSKRLGHLPPPLALPFDRPAPQVERFEKARAAFSLPREQAAALAALARREGATPFMLMLAAFQSFLARVAGQDEVTVGFVHANRPRPELEPLAGMFANYLLLRVELSGNPSFREILRRVRERYLESFEHRELPHVELVRLLRPPPAVDTRPLSPIGFVYQTVAAPVASVAGLTVRELVVDSEEILNELQLVVTEGRDGGLECALEYQAARFEPATVERLAARLRAQLARAAADPEIRLEALDPDGRGSEGAA